MPLDASTLQYRIAARLRKAGIASAMLDGRLIIRHVTGLSDVDLIARPEAEVGDADLSRVNDMVLRRERGEPVSRLIGYKEFYGRNFRVSRATLDPRPDTETLVETGLRLLPTSGGCSAVRVLDLGTGTGALIVTLLAERPFLTGVATDVSCEALDVCRDNACRHGVDDRLDLVCTDWANGVKGKFDLVVSNPPYIASQDILRLEAGVRNHDPQLALDGGVDGLDCYRSIFGQVGRLIRPRGHLVVEFGMDQHTAVIQIAQRAGLALAHHDGGLVRDLAGTIRCAVFEVC